MVQFEDVVKTFKLKHGKRVVLDKVTATFPTRSRIGILGRNGAGKSTLLSLIGGGEPVDSGRIRRSGRVSFPLGFSGAFHRYHSARQNISFLAHIYGMDAQRVTEWIEDFAELGPYFDLPLATYSSGMMARVTFGTSFAFDFDVYLVDEAIEVGDARFRAKCAAAFAERLETASLIMVSQNPATIRQYCRTGAVLNRGKLTMYQTIDEAFEAYEHVLREI